MEMAMALVVSVAETSAQMPNSPMHGTPFGGSQKFRQRHIGIVEEQHRFLAQFVHDGNRGENGQNPCEEQQGLDDAFTDARFF